MVCKARDTQTHTHDYVIIVITCELAQAEFGRDQIHACGPDWRMPESKGSMQATLGPASEE